MFSDQPMRIELTTCSNETYPQRKVNYGQGEKWTRQNDTPRYTLQKSNRCIHCVLNEGLTLETSAIVSFTAFHYPHQHTVDTPVCLLPCRRSYLVLLETALHLAEISLTALTNSDLNGWYPLLPLSLIFCLQFIGNFLIPSTGDGKAIPSLVWHNFHLGCLVEWNFPLLLGSFSSRVVGQAPRLEDKPALFHWSNFVTFLGQVTLLDHIIHNVVHNLFKRFFVHTEERTNMNSILTRFVKTLKTSILVVTTRTSSFEVQEPIAGSSWYWKEEFLSLQIVINFKSQKGQKGSVIILYIQYYVPLSLPWRGI